MILEAQFCSEASVCPFHCHSVMHLHLFIKNIGTEDKILLEIVLIKGKIVFNPAMHELRVPLIQHKLAVITADKSQLLSKHQSQMCQQHRYKLLYLYSNVY